MEIIELVLTTLWKKPKTLVFTKMWNLPNIAKQVNVIFCSRCNFEVIKEKSIKSTQTKPQLQVFKTCSSTKKIWETKKGKDYVKVHKINILVKVLKKKVSNTT
jgi:hypothetical protein